jgi:hypothetical protein
MTKSELLDRAQKYARRNALVIGEQLGFGIHGIVFVTESHQQAGRSAIKVHERQEAYQRERDVYLRLQESGVKQVRGCHVPQLLRHDDDLWVIEMSVVTRPYVLDFAGAYLDRRPEYPEEALADWRAEKAEQFGRHWPEVERVISSLERYGIFLADVSPSNVALTERRQ